MKQPTRDDTLRAMEDIDEAVAAFTAAARNLGVLFSDKTAVLPLAGDYVATNGVSYRVAEAIGVTTRLSARMAELVDLARRIDTVTDPAAVWDVV